MDRSQEDLDTPAWLRPLLTVARAYVNAQEGSELAAADASLRRVADSEALRKAPPMVRLSARDTIAEAYVARNMRTGEAAALDSAVTIAVEMAEDARSQFGAHSPQCAASITAAGYYLANRALDRGDPADAERSITLLREAMHTGAVPVGRRLWLLSGLGTALWARYRRSHDAGDLDQCITTWDMAKDELPEDSSDRPGLLRNLGVALADRFATSRGRADIDRAVEFLSQAVAATPPRSPSLAGRRQSLLAMLEAHFDATSQPTDLDRMASLLEMLARDAPVPLKHRYQAQLARVLDVKMTYVGGTLADLRRIAGVLQTVVGGTPANDPERQEYRAQLAMVLHQLAEATGDLELTNQAAELAAAALDATSPASPGWPGFARDLTTILSGRASKTRSRDDVDEAIRLLEQIDMASLSGPDVYLPRVSLGNALLVRFQVCGTPEDLDRAVELMEEAVSCTDPMTPQWLVARRNLARVLQVRHSVTGKPADLERLSSMQSEGRRTGDSAGRATDAKRLFEEYETTGNLSALDAAFSELAGELAETPGGSQGRFDVLLHKGMLLRRKHEHTGDVSLLNQAILTYEGLLSECPPASASRAWALAERGLCLRDRHVRTADVADLDRAIADGCSSFGGTFDLQFRLISGCPPHRVACARGACAYLGCRCRGGHVVCRRGRTMGTDQS